MNNILDYFSKVNNLSHAFLIGNVVFDEIEEDLIKIIKSKIFKNITTLRDNPDIYYYDQNINFITKEEIKELLSNLSKTSQFNNVKIYIINAAEKLSATVYNALLKTLEEPENNIYAFLITNNIDMVPETIKSRCQKIYLNSNVINQEIDDSIINISEKLIENIELYGVNTIYKYNKIYSEIDDREKLKKVLETMLEKYNAAEKELVNDNKNYSIITQNNDIICVSKKILVIDKYINLLNNYLNKNLVIDKIIIEIWRCK